MHVELRGDGARALRTFLAQHESARGGELCSVEGEEDVLTAAQLRLAATLLQRLRREDPTAAVPTLATFLHSRVRVVAATDAPDALTAEDAEKSAASEASRAQRRQKLLRLDEEMRYSRIVHNVKSKSRAGELEQFQTSARQHLSIGANMIMARVTAFIALYMVARALTDSETTVRLRGMTCCMAAK